MIDEFNKLMDEQRYEEAQVVAKQAAELDPENPVVTQVLWQAKFVRRFHERQGHRGRRRKRASSTPWTKWTRPSIPFADDKNPLVFPDAKEWDKLIEEPAEVSLAEHKRHRSEREIEIEKKLRTPVSLQFTNAPLSKVLDNLAKLAEVNLHLDPQGLAEEGVTTDTPGHDRPAQRDHAQERVEPDPRTAAPELRGQGRSAEDHQRADARRASLSR